MEGRGGARRGSTGLDVADALAIIFVIVLLSTTLCALLVTRNPHFVARTEEWMRVATNHLSLNLLAPTQAAAEAPPSTSRTPGS
jgi:K+-transporting ATPase A subunit